VPPLYKRVLNLKIYTIYYTILFKILCPYCLVSSLPVSTVDNITVETFIEIVVWRYLLYCRGWSSFFAVFRSQDDVACGPGIVFVDILSINW
jgi:hypothetical protein